MSRKLAIFIGLMLILACAPAYHAYQTWEQRIVPPANLTRTEWLQAQRYAGAVTSGDNFAAVALRDLITNKKSSDSRATFDQVLYRLHINRIKFEDQVELALRTAAAPAIMQFKNTSEPTIKQANDALSAISTLKDLDEDMIDVRGRAQVALAMHDPLKMRSQLDYTYRDGVTLNQKIDTFQTVASSIKRGLVKPAEVGISERDLYLKTRKAVIERLKPLYSNALFKNSSSQMHDAENLRKQYHIDYGEIVPGQNLQQAVEQKRHLWLVASLQEDLKTLREGPGRKGYDKVDLRSVEKQLQSGTVTWKEATITPGGLDTIKKTDMLFRALSSP